MFVKNTAVLIIKIVGNILCFGLLLLNLFTFERFKMIGVSDLNVSLDVNELFRFTQLRLAVARNLSNTFYGIYIMCLPL